MCGLVLHSIHFPVLMTIFEREYQDFERKSALFSLASSEVLIVNLWEHQVGLYQGANMGLLKTVFEVNLSLFGKKNADGYAGFCVSYGGETHIALLAVRTSARSSSSSSAITSAPRHSRTYKQHSLRT